MIFKDQYDSSFWNKSEFSGCILITIFAALWLMFAEYATSDALSKQHQLIDDPLRRILIASCLIIYFVRLQITVWVFQKRKWTWLETLTITVLMSFVLYAFAKVGGNNKQVMGIVEVFGILLYLSGSGINTHSEYYRHIWKLDDYTSPNFTPHSVYTINAWIFHFSALGSALGFHQRRACPGNAGGCLF